MSENTSGRGKSWKVTLKVPGGPPEAYVYKNDGNKDSSDPLENSFGKFNIGPGANQGLAKYWWDGSGPASDPDHKHSDTLSYQCRISIKDDNGDTLGNVQAWLYRATDGSGEVWWLAFGTSSLLNDPDLFPLYFSFSDPNTSGMQRWLTHSGTKRL